MRKSIVLFFILISAGVFGQEVPTLAAQPIVEEGKRLYLNEMASWYGTDVFLAKYPGRDNIGGYFSYVNSGLATCIFFSKAASPKVIGEIAFKNADYSVKNANLNLKEREFTAAEKDIYQLRKAAVLAANTDTFFKTYQNTQINPIPLIDGNNRRVYFLTGTSQAGVVVFGNDYLLSFDDNYKLLTKKALHQNILPIHYGNDEEDKESYGSVHSHMDETGDFITATDICTLMLYQHLTGWKQHVVVSSKYLNLWNCTENRLVVIPNNVGNSGNSEVRSGNLEIDTSVIVEPMVLENPFPAFSAQSGQVKINNEALKGKLVFINFWFATCPPCIAEMDELNSLYDRYKNNNNFQYVSFTYEHGQALAEAIAKYNMKYDVFSISRPECKRLNNNQGFPTSIVLNSEGEVIYAHTGGAMNKKDIHRFFRQEIYPVLDQELKGLTK